MVGYSGEFSHRIKANPIIQITFVFFRVGEEGGKGYTYEVTVCTSTYHTNTNRTTTNNPISY
jgi:hypothetical protein